MIDKTTDQTFTAITFAIRSGLYAFEQRGTATLLPWLQRYTAVSPAPGLPPWCLGLLNVRGTVQMAADLGDLLGFGPSEITGSSRLIFIEQGPAQLGLLVDSEIGVRYLQLHAVPMDALSVPFAVKVGVLDTRPVTVLDGSAVLRHVAHQLQAPAWEQ
jgi:chemotaxis signal transduction protein